MIKPHVLAVTLLSLVTFASGVTTPAYAAPDKIYTSSMRDRLQYRGFSVARPSSSAWYQYREEQSPPTALFRRDLPAGTHTAFVSVTLQSLPRTATSEADFARLARQDRFSDTLRFTVLSYHQMPIQVQGQWAIDYAITVRDKGAPVAHGKPLILQQSGRVIRHPTFPNGVVVINVSERGTRKELSPSVQAEGEGISEGVRLETAPGRPLI